MYASGSMYGKRYNRGYCYFLIIFQVVFVLLQIYIFYPCWQRDSRLSGSHAVKESEYQRNHQLGENGKGNDGWGANGLANGNTNIQNQIKDEGLLPPNQGLKLNEEEEGEKLSPHLNRPNLQVGINKNEPIINGGDTSEQQKQEQQLLEKQHKTMLENQGQLQVQQDKLKLSVKYSPNWESLDSRPVPQWYEDAKIGVFLHWGVYSVPSYVGVGTKGLAEWFWFYWKNEEYPKPLDEYHAKRLDGFIQKKRGAIESVKQFMERSYPIRWSYKDFAKDFKAELFNPKHWAKVFSEAGAKYVVLTSKHHDGYTLWPSKKSWNWNSMDIGPHRDLVDELGQAVKAEGLHYGLYHSLYEWFNPLYTKDKLSRFTTQEYVSKKLMPELHEIVEQYKPELVWSDGQFEAPCDYWNCTNFLTWLFNDSPVKDTVVTNDRWGTDVLCKHGTFLTCADRYSPTDKQSRKWESCITIDRESWGYRRNARVEDYYTIEGLIELLAQTVSNGGNLLMNIGPTAHGTIPPIFEERLKQLGSWLKINGVAIYGTRAWTTARDTKNQNVYYTSKATNEGPMVYAIITAWPEGDKLELSAPRPSTKTIVTWLGFNTGPISWTPGPDGGMLLTFPKVSIREIPNNWAWVVSFSNLLNSLN